MEDDTDKIYLSDNAFQTRHFVNSQQPLDLGHGLNRINGNYDAKSGKYFHLAVSSPLIFFGFLGICGVILIVCDRNRLDDREISEENIELDSFEYSVDDEAHDNQFYLGKQHSPSEMVIIEVPSMQNLEAGPESISSGKHIKSPTTTEAFRNIIFLKCVLKGMMAFISHKVQPNASSSINKRAEGNLKESRSLSLDVRSLNKAFEDILKSPVESIAIPNGTKSMDKNGANRDTAQFANPMSLFSSSQKPGLHLSTKCSPIL